MVKIFKSSRVFHTALFVWALYIPVAFILDRADTFALSGALLFTASLTVLHAYFPAMIIALRHGRQDFDYVDFLTLGIMCSWFAVTGRIMYILLLRHTVEIPAELSSYWFAFFQYVNFTGALLHLSARRVIKNHAPKTSVPRVAFAVVTGLILGTYLCVTN